MPKNEGGIRISGVTHPADQSKESWQDYPVHQPKDHGLAVLLRAPQEIVYAGLKAGIGALGIFLARTVGIKDTVLKAEKRIEFLQSRIEKGRGNPENLQEKIKEKQELLISLNEGQKLGEQILQIREKYQAYLEDDDYLLSLLAETIDNRGLQTIENNFLTSQGSDIGVKAISEAEIELAQKIMAKVEDSNDRSSLLIQEIQDFEKINLISLGRQLLNLQKIEEIQKIKEETTFNVNLINWDEALLAASLGATGYKWNALKGGYKIRIEGGNLVVYSGGDRSQIASLESVLVDVDLPGIYEAALAVANAEVPLFKWSVISNTIRAALGDNSLLPGRIDIGKTGSSEIVSYPALNSILQVQKLEVVRVAAIEMQKILKEIDELDIDIEDDDQKMVEKLVELGIKGAFKIPRFQVVMALMDQIKPLEQEGLSNKFRFDPAELTRYEEQEVSNTPELSAEEIKIREAVQQKKDDLKKAGLRHEMNTITAEKIIAKRDSYQQQLINKFGRKEGNRLFDLALEEALRLLDTDLETVLLANDLTKAGFIDGVDQRTAEKIIEYPDSYLNNFIEKFGEKEGKRLMKIIKQEALTILDIDLEKNQAIHDLFLAGYSETMTEIQAKDFINKIQLYRDRFIKMYGEQQGNRITNNVKSIAKQIIFNNQQEQ